MGDVVYNEGTKIGGNYQKVMVGGGTNGAIKTVASCTTSITSYSITAVSDITGLAAGMLVSGAAFMPNTYITSASGTTVVISRVPKTAGSTNQSVTFSKVYTAGHDDGFDCISDYRYKCNYDSYR